MPGKTALQILSLDADQDHQRKLIKLIKREDLPYEISPVENLPDARELLKSSRFDLLLVNFSPGEETAFYLLDDLEDIPWILLSSQESLEMVVRAFKSGAVDFVLKDSEKEYISRMPAILKRAFQHWNKGLGNKRYEQQLEKVVADRTQNLLETNQRLTEEISQRTQALQDLKESREIYRLFFQTSRDAIFISSLDGRWIEMNEAALDLFGYQDREQIWSDSILDCYWDPGDRKIFTRAIEKEGSVRDYPLKLKKKDGSSIDALVSAVPYEIGGRAIGVQGFIRDITDEIRAKDEKNQSLKNQTVIDDLSIEMGTVRILEDMYQSINTHLQRLFQLDHFNLLKYDQEQDRLQVDFEWNADSRKRRDPLDNLRFDKLDQSLIGQVIGERKSLMVICQGSSPAGIDLKYTLALNSNLDPGREIGTDPGDCSMLLAPIVIEDQVIGVLQIFNLGPNSFSFQDLAFLTRVSNVVAIGLQKAYLYQESLLHLEKLTSLQRIEQAILENLSLPTTLDVLVDQLVRELGVDAADVLYFHPALKTLKFITQTGFHQNILQHTDLEIGEGLAGRAAQTQSLVHVLNLKTADQEIIRSLEFSAEHFVSYFGVPLLAKGRLVGVMEVFQRDTLDPDQDWIDLLQMVAGLAAIAIDLQNLTNDLERSRNEISKAFDDIIEGWAEALELRGIESKGHWRRIEDLTVRLASKLGIEGKALTDIRRGTLLHDIGKMGIPDQVLLKGARLSTEERKLIGRHPVDAYELLKSVNELQSALDIPLYHHERWDGEGYPYRKAGKEIPLSARIFAVVDVWDAMQSERSYRKAFTKDEALLHLKQQSGKHFDPEVIAAFLEMIETTWIDQQDIYNSNHPVLVDVDSDG